MPSTESSSQHSSKTTRSNLPLISFFCHMQPEVLLSASSCCVSSGPRWTIILRRINSVSSQSCIRVVMFCVCVCCHARCRISRPQRSCLSIIARVPCSESSLVPVVCWVSCSEGTLVLVVCWVYLALFRVCLRVCLALFRVCLFRVCLFRVYLWDLFFEYVFPCVLSSSLTRYMFSVCAFHCVLSFPLLRYIALELREAMAKRYIWVNVGKPPV